MELIIGKYEIIRNHDKLWIHIIAGEDENEGGEFSLEEFEKVVDKFYEEHF